MFLLIVAPLTAQWRTANDTWDSRSGAIIKSDKLEHAVFFASTNLTLDLLFPSKQKHNWKYTLLIGVANEVKDALLPWERYGGKGGDGWSWKDTVFNILGVAVY